MTCGVSVSLVQLSMQMEHAAIPVKNTPKIMEMRGFTSSAWPSTQRSRQRSWKCVARSPRTTRSSARSSPRRSELMLRARTHSSSSSFGAQTRSSCLPSATCCGQCLHTRSTRAPPERLFSILNDTFEDDMDRSYGKHTRITSSYLCGSNTMNDAARTTWTRSDGVRPERVTHSSSVLKDALLPGVLVFCFVWYWYIRTFV